MIDVVLVGYGPVGVTLANLLGQAGLSVVAFERETSVYHLPRAGHFDGEVMRIFQSIGLADLIEPTTGFTRAQRNVNAEGKDLYTETRSPVIGANGWLNNYMQHQPYTEEILRKGVQRFPSVDVRLGCEVVSVADLGECAEVTARPVEGGEEHIVRARYVVGCDGGRSTVRRAIGSEHADYGLHQPWLVVDVLERQPLPLKRETVHFCDPRRPHTQVAKAPGRWRWEFMLMPGESAEEMSKPETIWRLVPEGVTPANVELERAAVYTFHSLVAIGWRKGRLLIAGDAAHQSPPFLGQGLCAGMRDAANLAWKLALVIGGRADDSLLDSYEIERNPHVTRYIVAAVELGGIIQTTDAKVAAERDRRMLAEGTPMKRLSVPLGPGLHGDAPLPAGMIAPQPILRDGRRLDDLIGPRFAVIADAGLLAETPQEEKARLERSGVVLLDCDVAEYRDWLEAENARAVVIRPDRYILGVARDSAGLTEIYKRIPGRGL